MEEKYAVDPPNLCKSIGQAKQNMILSNYRKLILSKIIISVALNIYLFT